ncbi:TetR/AcrR family transcriptional regulator [Mycobacterium vicinigordonae]|uniref:TetR/AcrR family transcriptional regulator n=1 Tax=Mycobacterium vicinigordonae TaxID=1719132 RepID=A0A7D6HU40_9MYCO|nr:TetR/AcrR family transcriptional regulator [Mycobacterium vicinigordonae]QLL07472.1 TetR/AcrR family transcriptional regulator [Mycobacterium vicinigordonae]
MGNPRATNTDLTAKARIRNAALDLYAQHGYDRVSLRDVAAEAGVTSSLVQHHFKTKAGLREAVDQLVVDYFAGAIAEVPVAGSIGQITAARDKSVRRMLEQNPPVVNYVRRALLEQSDDHLHLLDVLIDLTQREVAALRQSGRASTQKRESTQILTVLAQQMGELLLEPLVDAVWDRIAAKGDQRKPRLRVTVED